MKNEFISDNDYKTFWKLRTTLSQNGQDLVMENDCREYLTGLNEAINGEMGIVLSSWDNRDMQESFELDYGQSKSSSCDSAWS